ncbi:hypothetical protein [Nocardia xishanensis]|uniref:hypothetical protein n=1 Tax=Nocardia xishanensis TaxID=238964 RepID=UPI000829ECB1|nr:hypothetical protein [Nocardia xishanensis]
MYVSINQSNRSDRLAVVQALRTDRQKIYTDYSTALFELAAQLGNIASQLSAHYSRGAVHDAIVTFGQTTVKFLAQQNLVMMVGSDDVRGVAGGSSSP